MQETPANLLPHTKSSPRLIINADKPAVSTRNRPKEPPIASKAVARYRNTNSLLLQKSLYDPC